MANVDPRDIAARVRAIIAAVDDATLHAAASLIQVRELELRETMDDAEPKPSADVLAAVVVAYAVDPCWLVSGNYDPAAHRVALCGTRDDARRKVESLLRAPTPPLGSPTVLEFQPGSHKQAN